MKTRFAALALVSVLATALGGCASEPGTDEVTETSGAEVSTGRCAGTIATKTATIKVMTVNLRHDVDQWERRFDLIADEIVRLDPDVIGTQEVEINEDQADKLNDRLAKRGHAKYELSTKRKSGVKGFFTGEGIAIMSRWKIVEKQHEDIGEARVSIYARLQHPNGGFIDIIDTHLDSAGGADGDANRLDESKQTVDLTNRNDDCFPTFLTGDFNSGETGPAVTTFQAAGFVDSYKTVHGAEYTAKNGNTSSVKLAEGAFDQSPKHRIDYVLSRNAGGRTIRPISSEVVFKNHDAKGFYPSDHFGVITTFEVKM
ncbi:MAG: endonuclease/exonuclease/phosphatase family protein [Labilithrix sp.]